MDELKDYLKFIQKSFWLVGLFAIFGLVAAAVYNSQLQPKYQQTFLLYLVSKTVDSQFSGYYSQLAARDFTDTAIGILQSEAVSKLTAEKPVGDGFGVSVSFRRSQPQLIEVIAQSPNLKSLTGFAENFQQLANGVLESLGQNQPDFEVRMVGETQAPSKIENPIVLNLIVGFGLGAVVGLITSAIRQYLS